jgi:hypothetical protein
MKKLFVLLSVAVLGAFSLMAQDQPLDAKEQALLQSITQQLRPVFYEDYDASYNATIQDGHVTAWDFSYFFGDFPMSVVPELFKFPYVQAITITDGNLTGDISQLVDPTNIACADSLKVVNVNNNHLSGNIGALAAHFPNLTILHASYNRLSEVHPMISPNVWLELNSQTLDQTVELDIRNRQRKEDLIAALPEIVRYDHEAQSYGTCTEWYISWSWPNSGLTLVPYEEDGQNYVTYRPGGWDPIVLTDHDTISLSGSCAYSITCPLKIHYRMADVNFNSTVDITDLQALIWNALHIPTFDAINYYAADLYPDSVVNVQDVVLMVDTLLAHGMPTVSEAPRRTMSPTESEAEIYWLNGELHLRSDKDVTSLQVYIATEGTVEWNLGKEWLHSQAATGNGLNAVIYSLSGATIPALTDRVIARCTEDATVSYAALSDNQAQLIRVQTSAKMPTSMESIQPSVFSTQKRIENGQLLIIHNGVKYNAQGQVIK